MVCTLSTCLNHCLNWSNFFWILFFLFKLLSVSLFRYFVKKIHASTKLRQKLKEICKENEEPEIEVVLPIAIRWNTELSMAKTARRMKVSLTTMSESYNLERIFFLSVFRSGNWQKILKTSPSSLGFTWIKKASRLT